MIHQLIFLLYLAVLGACVLQLFKAQIALSKIYALALPLGTAVWSILMLVLTISGFSYNRESVLFLSLILLGIFIFFLVKKKIFSRKKLVFFGLFLVIFLIAATLAVVLNYSFFSNDSWRFHMEGTYFGHSQIPPESILLKSGILPGVLHAARIYFGFDYLYALYPLMALSFLLFLFFSFYLPERREILQKEQLFLFCIMAVVFLLSSFFVLFNAFYLHTNLLFAIYSFLGLYGIWKRLTEGSDIWIFISSMSLIIASFLRLEGPMFMFVILVILASREEIAYKEKLIFGGGVSLFVLAWNTRLILMKFEHPYKYFSKKEMLLILISYVLMSGFILLGRMKIIRSVQKYLPLMMLYILCLGWSYVLLTKGLKVKAGVMIVKKYGNLLLNIMEAGNWGILWIGLLVLFIVALTLKRFPFESVFLYYIFAFILLFNLVNLVRGGWRKSWGDSGNRMLLHLLFILAFYVFLKFKNVLFLDSNRNENA